MAKQLACDYYTQKLPKSNPTPISGYVSEQRTRGLEVGGPTARCAVMLVHHAQCPVWRIKRAVRSWLMTN